MFHFACIPIYPPLSPPTNAGYICGSSGLVCWARYAESSTLIHNVSQRRLVTKNQQDRKGAIEISGQSDSRSSLNMKR